MIRSIIIDDESSAIEVLKIFLQKKHVDTIEIVATTTSPTEGIKLIEELNPSLLFIDIQMPGITGIDLVSKFANPKFRVIFITAYDSYAIKAFKLSAIDYLLKPVDPEELEMAIDKAKELLEIKNTLTTQQIKNLQELLQNRSGTINNKVAIGMSDKIQFVEIKDILYCQASGAYTTVFMQDGSKIVASKSLIEFEEQFSSHSFFRIHHSVLININLVKEFQRHDGGYVIMNNNTKLEVSQRKRKDFLEAIHAILI